MTAPDFPSKAITRGTTRSEYDGSDVGDCQEMSSEKSILSIATRMELITNDKNTRLCLRRRRTEIILTTSASFARGVSLSVLHGFCYHFLSWRGILYLVGLLNPLQYFDLQCHTFIGLKIFNITYVAASKVQKCHKSSGAVLDP